MDRHCIRRGLIQLATDQPRWSSIGMEIGHDDSTRQKL
jgi:hypothetical protein